MKAPNYAPMYCSLYPALAEITRHHGYALAVHGTLGRDMDLICVPWTDAPSEPKAVVDAITKEFHIRTIGEPGVKPHGREAWTISVGFGECFIDLSFMPRVMPAADPCHGCMRGGTCNTPDCGRKRSSELMALYGMPSMAAKG